jgi:hypothetical protein
MPGNLHMIRIFRKSARLRQINATGNVRFKAQMWRPVRGKADFRSGTQTGSLLSKMAIRPKWSTKPND